MSFFDRLLNELIDVIEWVDTTQDTLVWKFPRNDNAIKMGAKLIVRESQVAIFINEGQIADVFTPGTYELHTQNMPLLTTLMSWKYGFNSPFKADVYFVSMRQFLNQRWGTKNPVMLRDAEFGPVRLRAFGSFNFKVQDPRLFLKEISATNPDFLVDNVNEQLRNTVVAKGMDAVAQSKINVLDLTANYNELGTLIAQSIEPDFEELGLTLTKLLVENISLPPEVEEALDKRSQMGIVGNLGAYAQFQAANAMEKAAENTIGGNLGAAGMGIGVGAAMMGQVGNIFQQNQFNPNADKNSPPPITSDIEYHIVKDGKSDGPHSLSELRTMIAGNLVNRETMIWTKGMATWAVAGSVDDLAAIFNNQPPPIA
ncbi:SPFH domain-containing protein [Mucilaginibacter sp. UR6-11]|uniref:SPFH domain-containing protein n=1 Tax=Mucilaginibacter sp. UR6-11 TaxID=1435644 RepID=UPI001E60AEA5|nr:SPFH domain-containing protein [Mucilaginibacter sp. UR6-11]MCC8426096.1 SPFH domain-containing protein [Mucilaginibacter sp. UR6-11]